MFKPKSKNKTKTLSIYVVDDSFFVRRSIYEYLYKKPQNMDYPLHFNFIGEAFLKRELKDVIPTIKADVIFLDMDLPDGTCWDLIDELQTTHPNLLIIAMCDETTLTTQQLRIENESKVFRILEKPFQPGFLYRVIEAAADHTFTPKSAITTEPLHPTTVQPISNIQTPAISFEVSMEKEVLNEGPVTSCDDSLSFEIESSSNQEEVGFELAEELEPTPSFAGIEFEIESDPLTQQEKVQSLIEEVVEMNKDEHSLLYFDEIAEELLSLEEELAQVEKPTCPIFLYSEQESQSSIVEEVMVEVSEDEVITLAEATTEEETATKPKRKRKRKRKKKKQVLSFEELVLQANREMVQSLNHEESVQIVEEVIETQSLPTVSNEEIEVGEEIKEDSLSDFNFSDTLMSESTTEELPSTFIIEEATNDEIMGEAIKDVVTNVVEKTMNEIETPNSFELDLFISEVDNEDDDWLSSPTTPTSFVEESISILKIETSEENEEVALIDSEETHSTEILLMSEEVEEVTPTNEIEFLFDESQSINEETEVSDLTEMNESKIEFTFDSFKKDEEITEEELWFDFSYEEESDPFEEETKEKELTAFQSNEEVFLLNEESFPKIEENSELFMNNFRTFGQNEENILKNEENEEKFPLNEDFYEEIPKKEEKDLKDSRNNEESSLEFVFDFDLETPSNETHLDGDSSFELMFEVNDKKEEEEVLVFDFDLTPSEVTEEEPIQASPSHFEYLETPPFYNEKAELHPSPTTEEVESEKPLVITPPRHLKGGAINPKDFGRFGIRK